MRGALFPLCQRVVTGLVLTVVLGVLVGCGSGGGDTIKPDQTPGSVASQVWSNTAGFVNWPALPSPTPHKPAWSLKVDKLFTFGGYALPGLPTGPGILAGLTSLTRLVGYSTTTGRQLWTTAMPPLAGTEPADDKPTVSWVQAPGLNLISVDRQVTTPADANGEDQIDVFDGVTGRFLWSRAAHGLSDPMPLDGTHLLFDLTDGDQENGLDEVNALAGTVAWHNADVAACEVYGDKIVCAAKGGAGVALVDPSTGATRWTTPYPETLKGAAFSTTSVIGAQGYFATGDSGTVTAIDLATGRISWQQDSGVDSVDQVVPLDAGHVAVAGLDNGVGGSTEQVTSMDVTTGRTTVVYNGTVTDGTDTSNGGLTVLRIGGKEYLLIVDPDGGIRTLDPTGRQIASVGSDCAGVPAIVGDTVGCGSTNGYTLYAIPVLAQRVQIPADYASALSVVAGSCLLDSDGTLTSVKS